MDFFDVQAVSNTLWRALAFHFFSFLSLQSSSPLILHADVAVIWFVTQPSPPVGEALRDEPNNGVHITKTLTDFLASPFFSYNSGSNRACNFK